MRINNNLMAMNTQRQLGINGGNKQKSIEKLSSGFRINRAGDDAAGLAISEKMRSQIRGLNQASRNSQDGISLIQTAEGALSESQAILQRMRELSVQASNDTNTGQDRGEIQKEVNQLSSEINRISKTTEFNKRTLLDGSVNAEAAVSANVKGAAVSGNVKVISTATKGSATGAAITSTATEISAVAGISVTGDVAYANRAVDDDAGAVDVASTAGTSTGTVLANSLGATFTVVDDTNDGQTVTSETVYATHAVADSDGPDVTAADNELTLSIDGTQVTVALAAKDYGAGGNSADDFAADLQTAIQAKGGDFGTVTVGFDAANKLVITSDDDAKDLTVDGGNMLTHLTAAGTTANLTNAKIENNNDIKLSVDGGAEQTISMDAATYDLTGADNAQFITDLNAKLVAGGVAATASFVADKLVFTSDSEGTTSSVDVTGGELAKLMVDADPANDVKTTGTSNRELIFTYKGETQSITMDEKDYGAGGNDMNDFAADLQAKIQALGTVGTTDFTKVSVGFDANDKLQFTTSDATDTTSDFTVDGGSLEAVVSGGTYAAATSGAGNTDLVVTVGGSEKTIVLSEDTYDLTAATAPGAKDQVDFLADLNAKLDTAYGNSNVVATFTADDKLVLTNNADGSGSVINEITGGAAAALGIDTANSTIVAGSDVNNTAKITIDGTDVNLTIADGDYSGGNIASDIQTQINAVSGLEDATVSFEDGAITIQSGTEGVAGTIVLDDSELWNSLNVSTADGGVATAGADELDKGLNIQVGANANQTMNISVSDMRSKALNVTSETASGTIVTSDGETASFVAVASVSDGTSSTDTEYALDLSTSDKATAAISAIDDAITSVSAERSKLGAFQNRLEHTIKNLDTSAENLQAAESRIRDVDMAKEMMTFTKNDILSQAAQAMLAQANQAPKGVLQLLR